MGARGAVHRSDGPDEFRRAVREEIKQGAEIIKMFVTGGHGTVAPGEQTEMSRDELTAGVEAAHERGALVRGRLADIVLWDADHEGAFAWNYGLAPRRVWRGGEPVTA